jgi:acyl carrier protein
MTKEDIARKMKVILCGVMTCLEPSEIEPDCELAGDLGFDSLDYGELVLAIEEEFGIEGAWKEGQEMLKGEVTVQDLVDSLGDKLLSHEERFPIEDGWLHMDIEMMTAKLMSEAEIKEIALMGRAAEGQEFGLVEQNGKQVKVILRERTKVGEAV